MSEKAPIMDSDGNMVGLEILSPKSVPVEKDTDIRRSESPSMQDKYPGMHGAVRVAMLQFSKSPEDSQLYDRLADKVCSIHESFVEAATRTAQLAGKGEVLDYLGDFNKVGYDDSTDSVIYKSPELQKEIYRLGSEVFAERAKVEMKV